MSTNLENEERTRNVEEDATLAALAEEEGTNAIDNKHGEPAETEQTVSTVEAVEEVEQAKPTTTEPEKPSKPSGVLSKDGTSVLPFAVVKSARAKTHEANLARLQAEAERDALRQQLEDFKAGKTPTGEDDDPLDAAVAEAAQEVPILAELHKRLKAAEAALKQGGKPQPADTTDAPSGDPLQDDIDTVPQLAGWQAEGGEQWQRAVAIDRALEGSPKWRDKPRAERFAFVTKQVADEFDIQVEDPAPQNQTETPSKADPAAVVSGARRTAPNTLSDFKGGATDTTGGRIENLPSRQLRARIDVMSDEEMDEHLSKLG